MRRMRGQHFPERMLRTGGTSRGQSPVGVQVPWGFVRHYLWARSIIERFALRDRWPAWKSGELIHLCHRWRVNVTRNMSVTQRVVSHGPGGKPSVRAQVAVGFTPPRYRPGSAKNGAGSNPGPVLGSNAACRIGQPAVVSRSAVDGHVSSSVMRRRPAINSRATDMAMGLADRRGSLTRPLKNEAEHYITTQTVVTRVKERHRRVEEHRAMYVRNLRLQTEQTNASASEMTIAAEARLRRPQSTPRAAVDVEVQRSGRSTPPVIDPARLTDEVLKQLDRRLVAARERMGRI